MIRNAYRDMPVILVIREAIARIGLLGESVIYTVADIWLAQLAEWNRNGRFSRTAYSRNRGRS
jgi:hypothetical protein